MLRKYIIALAPGVLLIFYGFYLRTTDESGLSTLFYWLLGIFALFGGLLSILSLGVVENTLKKTSGEVSGQDTKAIQLRDALLCFAGTATLANLASGLREGSNPKKALILIAFIPLIIGCLRLYSFVGSFLKSPVPFYTLKQQYKIIAVVVIVLLAGASWLTIGPLFTL